MLAHGDVEEYEDVDELADEDEQRCAVVSEMLPKNLIALLPVQDRKRRDSGGLLSRTAVHAVDGMGSPVAAAASGTTVVLCVRRSSRCDLIWVTAGVADASNI